MDALSELLKSLEKTTMLNSIAVPLRKKLGSDVWAGNELRGAFEMRSGARTTRLSGASCEALALARAKTITAENALAAGVNEVRSDMKKEQLFELEKNRHVYGVERPSIGKAREQGATVRGESRSGKTVYVEPKALRKLSEALAEAKRHEEKVEEQRLSDLCRQAVRSEDVLQECLVLAGHIDAFRARGRLGFYKFQGVIPTITNDGTIDAKEARHPLVVGAEKNAKGFDIFLGPGQACLVQGPNGSGKSCFLATVGLLALLAKMAVPVPARKATISTFEYVFADMDLASKLAFPGASTYEAHLSFVATALKDGDHRLILMDELGSGTDFDEGGAIAATVLETLVVERRFSVAAATHHPTIKALAVDQANHFDLYAFFLDAISREPTFALSRKLSRKGLFLEGGANAFDAAKRRGLPPDLIARAKDRTTTTSSSSSSSNDWLAAKLDAATERAEAAHKEAQDEREKLVRERQRARESLKAATQEALEEVLRAARRIDDKEQRLESLFRELKERPDRDTATIIGDTIRAARLARKASQNEKRSALLANSGLSPHFDAPRIGDSLVLVAFDDDFTKVITTVSGTVSAFHATKKTVDLQIDKHTTLHNVDTNDLATWATPVFADGKATSYSSRTTTNRMHHLGTGNNGPRR